MRADPSLLDLIPAIIWDGDPCSWRFHFVSRPAELLLGYPVQSWLEDPNFWADHIHPEDRERVVSYCKNKTAEGAPHSFQYRMIAADGHVVWLQDTVNVEVVDGRPVRFYGVMVDITDRMLAEAERKQAEEALRALTEELERRVLDRTTALAASTREMELFTYSVSHDLRAPLRAIAGYAEALEHDEGGRLGERGRHYLDRMRAATSRMGGLIDGLLALGRMGRVEVRRERLGLSGLARDIAVALEGSVSPPREVEWVIAEGVEVMADPQLTHAVMENLLGNAWKFTSHHARARIEFGVRREADAIAYFVRDDGAGFDMAYADQLFLPFHRIHAAAEFEGTGIGLATVQRAVQRQGGRVWAEGAVEHGATVWFTLG
ncbi:MAG: PAS domain-containing protein [Pseudomonadota bacterium]|nr:PAS domain-containing protein [Pseudomonadota bacterium]